ncbi:TadE family type IV pilus minor pilin [Streptomyces sp. BE20]|uniref:TadE family type IV pilus minor pilin n=1 Tax=Streptomyces sp. BE20 TaxID=3002525 RepID=UPI002E772F6B|nr:TadE family type IV pilus minor pilin [Streptomyces sp. BE20]MEE1829252.1 TadE family type IV pilus minor pilin [Streptomyces sp. BE20]
MRPETPSAGRCARLLPAGCGPCATRSGRLAPTGRNGRRRRRGDGGFVTAETAVALPALVLLAAMLVWAVLAAGAQVRCVDAAREGARAAARGEADAAGIARAVAPPGAEVRIDLAADTVRVTVDAPSTAPGGLGSVLSVRLGAAAVAAREDTLRGGEGGAGPWPT